MSAPKSTTFDPYTTSYKHEFYRKDSQEDFNARPPSHIKLENGPLKSETTYGVEFSSKKVSPNQPLWSGGNNPHPSEAFMQWKYPSKQPAHRSANPENPGLTNEEYDRVMRGKCKSTYQKDYRGLPPGQMPADYSLPVAGDWKANIPYTLDSFQRIAYQPPNQVDQLKDTTGRFGHSGADRHRLLVGITPNASKRIATVVTKTTYDNHYNDCAPLSVQRSTTQFPEHARRVVRGKGPAELSQMYEEIRQRDPSIPAHVELPPRVPSSLSRTHIPDVEWATSPVPEPIVEPDLYLQQPTYSNDL